VKGLKKLAVILVMVLIVTLISCTSKKDANSLYSDAHKHLVDLEGYKCQAQITIYNSRGENKFLAQHWFKSPNKYRLESTSLNDNSKFIVVYNGSKAWLYNPQITSVSMIENFYQSDTRVMFVGSFTGHFLESENIKYSLEQVDGINCIAMTTKIPWGNHHHDSQKLWVTKKDFKPYKMEVYNSKGETTIGITYSKFSYDNKLSEDIFNLTEVKTFLINK
jgi:outer membrane lipoprotein-sorting protein